MSKPHSITVSIVSESDGVINQEVILREYAGTADELVAKNFVLADKVVAACMAATVELAAGSGYKKGK